MYCLCANANRYIEDKLPPVDLFLKNDCHIVLGTDSYSSNWQLNIAKEIEAVLGAPCFSNMPYEQSLETVLKWATINGAIALQIDNNYGSFDKGKKPGIVLIQESPNTHGRGNYKFPPVGSEENAVIPEIKILAANKKLLTFLFNYFSHS